MPPVYQPFNDCEIESRETFQAFLLAGERNRRQIFTDYQNEFEGLLDFLKYYYPKHLAILKSVGKINETFFIDTLLLKDSAAAIYLELYNAMETTDFQRIWNALKQAAFQLNDSSAQLELYQLYLSWGGQIGDEKTALEALTASAKQKNPNACLQLGQYFILTGANRKAFELFLIASEAGLAEASYQLGIYFKNGIDAKEPSPEIASRFLKLALEQNPNLTAAKKALDELHGFILSPENGNQLTLILYGKVELKMVMIAPGSFLMGSMENEYGRNNNERLHRVTLKKTYWLGQYLVTQAQWKVVMGTGPFTPLEDNLPAGNITWQEAKRFCERLNLLYQEQLPNGYQFDLPSEAQWEYACRAGTTTAFNNGRNLTNNETYNHTIFDEIGCVTEGILDFFCNLPVGIKKPNAWGLYDMHGNCWEWCRDRYEENYADDPEFPEQNGSHVVRGGDGRMIKKCRSASRDATKTYFGSFIRGSGLQVLCHEEPIMQAIYSPSIGFRLALVPFKEDTNS